MRRAMPLFAPLLLAWPATAGFSQGLVAKEAVTVAPAALSTFRELVKQQKNYREMGLESVDELEKAALGDPFLIFTVRLDELGGYKDGQDPGTLLHQSTQVLIPILVEGKVRSSLTVASNAKGWGAVAFGGPNKINLLSHARAASMQATRLSLAEHFCVEIPGLRLVFVGHRSQGVLMLTPILDNPGFRLRAGVTLTAAEVFTATRSAAKAHQELPG
jgi:hypothetical protein